jgi:hypothetical protein
MAGICVSAIAALKLYHGTEFNWENDEFLSRVERVEGVGDLAAENAKSTKDV